MRIEWDKIGEREYETGVKNGVLYPYAEDGYGKGVAWNGLISVTESPSGAEPTKLYADDSEYGSLTSREEFGGTIEAYMSPPEFDQCDGTAEIAPGVTIGQQERKIFGMCYRTVLGNDTKNEDYGYKLHIVYGGKAKPTEKQYSSINDSPEAATLSWEFTTTPVSVPGHKPTSIVTINSTKVNAEKLKTLEDSLYGTAEKEPTILMPDKIIEIMGVAAAG